MSIDDTLQHFKNKIYAMVKKVLFQTEYLSRCDFGVRISVILPFKLLLIKVNGIAIQEVHTV